MKNQLTRSFAVTAAAGAMALSSSLASATVLANVDLNMSSVLNGNNVNTYTSPDQYVNHNVIIGDEAYMAQGAANAYTATPGPNLPDNGQFTDALGITGFDVTLNYRSTDTTNANVLLIDAGGTAKTRTNSTESSLGTIAARKTATLNLGLGDQLNYESLYIFAAAQNGNRTLAYTLTYADLTTSSGTFTVPDAFTDPAPAGTAYLIDGMDRYRAANGGFNSVNDVAVFGMSLSPDDTKTLTTIQLFADGTGGSNNIDGTQVVTVFGISGQAVIPEPASLALMGLGGLLMLGGRRRGA